jgi:hypothetical protein
MFSLPGFSCCPALAGILGGGRGRRKWTLARFIIATLPFGPGHCEPFDRLRSREDGRAGKRRTNS